MKRLLLKRSDHESCGSKQRTLSEGFDVSSRNRRNVSEVFELLAAYSLSPCKLSTPYWGGHFCSYPFHSERFLKSPRHNPSTPVSRYLRHWLEKASCRRWIITGDNRLFGAIVVCLWWSHGESLLESPSWIFPINGMGLISRCIHSWGRVNMSLHISCLRVWLFFVDKILGGWCLAFENECTIKVEISSLVVEF